MRPQRNQQRTPEEQRKSVENTVRHLQMLFNVATNHIKTRPARVNNVPNRLYKLQTEFAYHIHEIQMSPPAILPKLVDNCNRFINTLLEEKKASQKDGK